MPPLLEAEATVDCLTAQLQRCLLATRASGSVPVAAVGQEVVSAPIVDSVHLDWAAAEGADPAWLPDLVAPAAVDFVGQASVD